MNRIFRLLLISCMFVFLFSASPGRAMYTDSTREGYLDELLEYMENHNILIKADDNTTFTSLEAIEREIERREKDWQELASQEWGVYILSTLTGFGDLNLLGYPEGAGEEEKTEWAKHQQEAQSEGGQAIVFTPFRTDLATLALVRKIYGDEKMRKMAKNLEREVEKPKHFYLKSLSAYRSRSVQHY